METNAGKPSGRRRPPVFGPEPWPHAAPSGRWSYWDVWFTVACVVDCGGDWDEFDGRRGHRTLRLVPTRHSAAHRVRRRPPPTVELHQLARTARLLAKQRRKLSLTARGRRHLGDPALLQATAAQAWFGDGVRAEFAEAAAAALHGGEHTLDDLISAVQALAAKAFTQPRSRTTPATPCGSGCGVPARHSASCRTATAAAPPSSAPHWPCRPHRAADTLPHRTKEHTSRPGRQYTSELEQGRAKGPAGHQGRPRDAAGRSGSTAHPPWSPSRREQPAPHRRTPARGAAPDSATLSAREAASVSGRRVFSLHRGLPAAATARSCPAPLVSAQPPAPEDGVRTAPATSPHLCPRPPTAAIGSAV